MAVFAVRMMGMLLMKELRRGRYLARHGNTSAVLQILVILVRFHVHLVLLAGRLRRLADVAAVENVDLPAQVTMREALENKRMRNQRIHSRDARPVWISDYLIIHRIGGVLVGRPLHDTRLAVVAHEGQGALIGSEGREFVRGWLILIRHPIAKTTHARGDGLAALPAHTGEYLYFLSKSESEQPLRTDVSFAFHSSPSIRVHALAHSFVKDVA